MFKNMFKALVCTLAAVFLFAPSANAAYPDHPITVICVFGAGGGSDIPARILAKYMEKKLGQPVVVQNVVGGAGTTGLGQILSSKPDGYTLGYVPIGPLVTQPHLVNVPYARDSIDFIGQAVEQPQMLLSSNQAPWKTLDEMIKTLQANPGKYVCGITGVGNLTHLPLLAFSKKYGVKLKVIPFRSPPDICKEMLANRVQLYFCEPLLSEQFGLKGYLQTTHQPAKGIDLPTFKDLGIEESLSVWQTLLAPKGLPEEVRSKLEKAMEETLKDPEFIADIHRISMTPSWLNGKDMLTKYNREYDMFGAMLTEAGIRKK